MISNKCIKVSASRQDYNINILVSNIVDYNNIKVTNLDSGLIIKTDKVENNLVINTTNYNINIVCSEICCLDKSEILKIIPKSIFLAKGNNYINDVSIITDIKWEAY